MNDSGRGTTRPLAGTFFYVLLALADRDRYGLDIAEEVARRTNGGVVLGPGTLYNGVRKMVAQGLIEDTVPRSETDDSPDDPRRRYYRITQKGRSVLANEAAHLNVLVQAARGKDVL